MESIKEVEYYTLKEIIFGLRKEYLKNESSLNSLKPLCFINKSKISEYKFEIFQLDFKSPDLYCVVNKKKNLLKKLVTNNCDSIYNTAVCLRSGGNYKLYNYEKNPFPVVVSNINQEDFKKRAYKILHSDFTKKIKTKDIHFWSPEMTGFFKCEHNYLEFNLFFDAKYGGKKIDILYYPSDDVVVIEENKDVVTDSFTKDNDIMIDDKFIELLLNIKVKKDILPRYHKNLIESMPANSKNIIVEGVDNAFSLVNMQIKDTDFFSLLTPAKLCKNIKFNKIILDGILSRQKMLSIKR